ncbi:hypothetical protein C8Q77DRAFT_1071660 [Trametes polyzona]|nr:hypothetical protein C8Q77DRAFT_1071660 [Trametes polyzona]
MSADILSQHLIMPLISAAHLSFFSADPVSSLPEADVEKSADRVGRIARRAVDTHVKNTLSKPLVATTLRRMGAVLNFVPDPPRIVTDVQAPDLTLPTPPAEPPFVPQPPLRRNASPTSTLQDFLADEGTRAQAPVKRVSPQPTQDDDSVTEEEPEEEELLLSATQGKEPANDSPSTEARASSPVQSVPSKRATPDHPAPPTSRETSNRPARDSSSPAPIPKKPKRRAAAESSSDDSSADEQKGRAPQSKSGARRGVKQPIKRAGRRF